jgi:hypothetical protein
MCAPIGARDKHNRGVMCEHVGQHVGKHVGTQCVCQCVCVDATPSGGSSLPVPLCAPGLLSGQPMQAEAVASCSWVSPSVCERWFCIESILTAAHGRLL